MDRDEPQTQSAKEMLGWTPKIKLEEGLKKTIEHYRSNVNKSDQKVLRRRSQAT